MSQLRWSVVVHTDDGTSSTHSWDIADIDDTKAKMHEVIRDVGSAVRGEYPALFLDSPECVYVSRRIIRVEIKGASEHMPDVRSIGFRPPSEFG